MSLRNPTHRATEQELQRERAQNLLLACNAKQGVAPHAYAIKTAVKELCASYDWWMDGRRIKESTKGSRFEGEQSGEILRRFAAIEGVFYMIKNLWQGSSQVEGFGKGDEKRFVLLTHSHSIVIGGVPLRSVKNGTTVYLRTCHQISVNPEKNREFNVELTHGIKCGECFSEESAINTSTVRAILTFPPTEEEARAMHNMAFHFSTRDKVAEVVKTG